MGLSGAQASELELEPRGVVNWGVSKCLEFAAPPTSQAHAAN